MTTFNDEYEYEASDLNTYFIEVEGSYFEDETGGHTELSRMEFSDEAGNIIDTDDEIYRELVEDANNHDCEVEVHETDTSFYGNHEEDIA